MRDVKRPANTITKKMMMMMKYVYTVKKNNKVGLGNGKKHKQMRKKNFSLYVQASKVASKA